MNFHFYLPSLFLILFSLTTWAAPGNSDPDYRKVREHFVKIYAPVVLNESGLQLEIQLSEETPDYFGGMSIEEGKLLITIGSKAHLEKAVTPDSYMALLCHEVGHRLGGAPFKDRPGDPPWSSTEGQSDYYSGLTCLRKVFLADPETQKMKFHQIPLLFHQKCQDSNLHEPRLKNVCLRTIQAGIEMIDRIHAIYLDFPNPPPRPNILTPETAGNSVGNMYPSMQCRLDTYVHGALQWPRPACWYLP